MPLPMNVEIQGDRIRLQRDQWQKCESNSAAGVHEGGWTERRW